MGDGDAGDAQCGRVRRVVDANPATAREFQVISIPTLILFKDGKPVTRIVGAKGKPALLTAIAEAL